MRSLPDTRPRRDQRRSHVPGVRNFGIDIFERAPTAPVRHRSALLIRALSWR